MNRTLTCLVCPRGCTLRVDEKNNVTGNFCPRGIPYALQELKEPKRTLTFAIHLKNSKEMLPLKTDAPVLKSLIPQIVDYLKTLDIEAPIDFNQVIVQNVLNTGVNVVASKKIV